jgi:DNA-binding transcriptional MerR regulator
MAYYDEEFVRKLKIAETMKNEKYSLDQIKRLINSNSGSVNDFCFQILDSVNRLLPYGMRLPLPYMRYAISVSTRKLSVISSTQELSFLWILPTNFSRHIA